MSEQYFEDINPAELQDQALTEKMMVEYADQALAESIVSVNVSECRHPFIYLPSNFAEIYQDLPNPPKNVDSVDLELQYDRADQKFITAGARINLDTKYSLNFYKIAAQLEAVPGHSYAYWMTNAKNETVSDRDKTDVLSEAELASLLQAVGIGLPQSPQAASWDEIKAILQFAGHWSARSSNRTVIDPARTVIITDRVTGSSMDNENKTLAQAEGINSRSITFALDEAPAPAALPETTWKLMARSNTPSETPVLDRLELIPLVYEVPKLEDFDFSLLLAEPVRKEVRESSVRLPLTPQYLQAARAAISAATKLL